MSLLKKLIQIPVYTVIAVVLVSCIPIWVALWLLFGFIEVTDHIA